MAAVSEFVQTKLVGDFTTDIFTLENRLEQEGLSIFRYNIDNETVQLRNLENGQFLPNVSIWDVYDVISP